jgi:8-amino-7-oxononanoate synthase
VSWAAWIDDQCRLIDAAGQWRAPRDFDATGPEGLLAIDPNRPPSAPVVSFASNDYLGLTQHPAGKAAAREAIDQWGTGAGAARLVVGARSLHRALEHELASWRGTESALLFPTGFAANLGVLTTFGAPGVRICSDELNHASIIDGCRLARAEATVYRHGDLDQLDALLRDAPGRSIVVTDTVFSMDGDVAPLDGILERCLRHGAMLILDEAHAVLGPHPDLDAIPEIEVARVGTLSKTLGSLGGFVAGTRRLTELLINRARPFIFTTASTPADTAAAVANLAVLRSAEGAALCDRLRANVDRLVPNHPSPILPIIVGDERDAVTASAALLARGLLVPAIRPPTVAPGTSRLRIALSAAHTDAQLDALHLALDELGLRPSPSARSAAR